MNKNIKYFNVFFVYFFCIYIYASVSSDIVLNDSNKNISVSIQSIIPNDNIYSEIKHPALIDLPGDVIFWIYDNFLEIKEIGNLWVSCNCTSANVSRDTKQAEHQVLLNFFRKLKRKSLNINNRKINDNNLDNIINKFSVISNIYLINCINITDISIFKIASSVNLLDLTNLDVSGCSLFTDVGIIDLLKNAPNLTCLNISNCIKITDKTSIELGKSCFKLTFLDVSSCNFYQEDPFIKIMINCKNLTHLDLCYCSIFEEKTIKKMAEKLFNLKLYLKDSLGFPSATLFKSKRYLVD